MIQTIIGLNGRLHSGKDTAFAEIDLYFAASGLKAKRVAFADPLKMSAALALGFQPQTVEDAVAICNDLKENGVIGVAIGSDAHYEDDEIWVNAADTGITGREYLQLYGTEAHRDVFGQDFWVNATLPKTLSELDEKYAGVDVLVVTDVRFENEAKRVQSLGGEVWYIDANERLGPLPDDAHPSEHPLPSHCIDHTVENNHSLTEFHLNLHAALDGM